MDNAQQAASTAGSEAVARPLLYLAMWQRIPALAKADLLAGWGYDVRVDFSYSKDELNDTIERLLAIKPAAILLSLDEFPGYTRSLALGLKPKRWLQEIPRIAVGGESAQAELLTRAVPDVAYCGWDELRELLAAKLGAAPPAADVAPLPEVMSFL